MLQKLFRVKIYAYQYHADFIVKSADSALDIENAIVDTLGKDDITWDYLGEMMNPKVNRITYEEVINGDAKTSVGPLHKEEGSRPRVGAGAS